MQDAFLVLDLQSIEAQLGSRELCRNTTNEVWLEIGSTNTRALELARVEGRTDFFVAARQQVAGRGRLGRKWETPRDAGIAFSLLIKPDFDTQQLSLITMAAGVAVARAIEAVLGFKPGLKWVNDVVYNGRKLAGILAEMNGPALVIGIGINLRFDDVELPDDLSQKIEWLERIDGVPVDPNILVANLIKQLEICIDELAKGNQAAITSAWKVYSVTLGKDVEATAGNLTLSGRAVDIDRDGALLIEDAQGEQHRLHAGEISLRMADGSYC